MDNKPTNAEATATTLPGGAWDGWRCENHPVGEEIANAKEREVCWACGKSRPGAYGKYFGVNADFEIVEIEAAPVDGGFIARQGCWRYFIEKEKLSETREGAEARRKMLQGG